MFVNKLPVILGFALFLTSCSGESQPMESEASAAPETELVTLSKEQFDYAGIELGKMEIREFHEKVRSTGVLDVPPGNIVSVHAYFGGYVKKIDLLPGERVRQGQLLFVLENPEYIPVQQEFLELQGQLAYLESDYERQKSLSEENVTARKNFLKAESEYKVAMARHASLKRQLELMNIDPDKLTSDNLVTTMNVYAPISGFVTEVDVFRGSFLDPADMALTITNTDHIHLELNVFERDLPKLAVGQPISFFTQDDPSKNYEAEVHLINKRVDPETRTVNIHGHLVDEKHAAWFSTGMYVEAEIYTNSSEKPALPEQAVVELDGSFYVLVQEKTASGTDYAFSMKAVKTGTLDHGYLEILNADAFSSDAVFMLKGAFNLIAE